METSRPVEVGQRYGMDGNSWVVTAVHADGGSDWRHEQNGKTYYVPRWGRAASGHAFLSGPPTPGSRNFEPSAEAGSLGSGFSPVEVAVPTCKCGKPMVAPRHPGNMGYCTFGGCVAQMIWDCAQSAADGFCGQGFCAEHAAAPLTPVVPDPNAPFEVKAGDRFRWLSTFLGDEVRGRALTVTAADGYGVCVRMDGEQFTRSWPRWKFTPVNCERLPTREAATTWASANAGSNDNVTWTPCNGCDVHRYHRAQPPAPAEAKSKPTRVTPTREPPKSLLCTTCSLGSACTHHRVREPYRSAIDEWDLLPDAGR